MNKKLLVVFITLFVNFTSLTAFAADQVVKEDTTPPSAEGALTAEQIPPIDSVKHAAAHSQKDSH